MRQTYEIHKVVEQEDLDDLAHVNNIRYVQWVQDIASEHWQEKSSTEITKSYYWILLEHRITYKNPALLGDVLKIVTYVEKSEGVRSQRVVEFYNHNTDTLLATSNTSWCFMSSSTNKPTRIPQEITDLFL